MGYFFRKSANFGLFRLNFSKSGIGASVGIPGARLTMTPHGTTYITAGRHGFYYRETLSNRRSNPAAESAQPAGMPLSAASPSDEIITADVSDLVDSSSEILIQRLNERAQMTNPAWILYVIGTAILCCAWAMFSAGSTRDSPDSASQLRAERNSSNMDDYSALVTLHGYPNSVTVTELLASVPVRIAHYSSANLKIVFVPVGCVGAYEAASRTLATKAQSAALAKRQNGSTTRCAASPDDQWTIARYIDPAKNKVIGADIATTRLGKVTIKRASPPILKVEGVSSRKKTQDSGGIPKNQMQASSVVLPDGQTWAIQERLKQKTDKTDLPALYSLLGMLSGGLGLFVIGFLVHKQNTEKRTSRLFYELDEVEQQKYSIVNQALAHLGKSHRTWRIEARSATSDWKRNAGAAALVRRVPTSVRLSSPPRVETNLAIPCIDIGQAKMFFLPDAILYLQRGTFGGIPYNDFRVEQCLSRFIEEEQVPADATVVDRTWRYINKSGGPDRRFNNNTELPVVQYGALLLTSSRGLNIQLNTSNAQASLAFANCWRALHSQVEQVNGRQSAIPKRPDVVPDKNAQAFRVLGLPSNASPGEISAAYHQLAQLYHPDKVVGLAPEFGILADKRMKEINAAYASIKQRQQV
jgi:hypothetical protein